MYVRKKGRVISLHAVSGGSKSSPFSEKVLSAPVHFFMIFKKVILIRKNDRLTPPVYSRHLFSCGHRRFFLAIVDSLDDFPSDLPLAC